jgi:hypothetical protein
MFIALLLFSHHKLVAMQICYRVCLNFTTYPILYINHWFSDRGSSEACNYLLVYEYVPDFKADAWAAFKRGLATNTIGDDSAQTSRAKTILLGGRKDGHICVFDWDDGRVIFSIDVSTIFTPILPLHFMVF